MDEDLTIKARIDDELSRPLEGIRDNVRDVGREAETSSRRASRGTRGWDLYGRATERAGKLAHRAGRLIRGAALAIGAGLVATAYGAARLAKSSISAASDLNESLNAVNVTYGKQAGAVKKLGRQAAETLGLSNTAYNGMAVQFASFAQTIGGSGPGSVKILDKITTRAADFASVMNLEVAEATALFQSGLAGESEPLRRYGINLSAAAVQAYALSKGIIEGKEQLTDSQKVQATYGLLMEKTSKTAGDFTNTSGELANQQRILDARMENARARLGRGLLPVMQTATKWLNREGVPAFLRFSDWFNDEGIPAVGRFVDKARTFYEKHGPQIKSALADVRDVAQGAADAAGKLVDAFLNIPGWARKALVGGVIGGAAAKKLGITNLIKGGSSVAKLASMTKPLPVFVVNNGVGVGGAAGGGAAVTGGAAAASARTWGARAAGALKSAVAKAGWLTIGITAADTILGDPKDNKILDPIGNSGRKTGDWIRSKFGNQKVDSSNPWASLYDGDDAEATGRRIDKVLDASRAKAAGFGKELDLVGARKVTPTVKTDQIKRANDALSKFVGYQIDARRPVSPYINTSSIERAISAARTLADTIHAIPNAGLDNGANYVSGGNRPAPPRSGAGGGGRNNATTPRTTPRAAAPSSLTLERSPRAATSEGIRVDNLNVDARYAKSDVDVTGAVKRALEEHERDRRERK